MSRVFMEIVPRHNFLFNTRYGAKNVLDKPKAPRMGRFILKKEHHP